MDLQRLAYAIACVLVPILWGLVIVWISNRIEGRVSRRLEARSGRRRDVPPTEYHI